MTALLLLLVLAQLALSIVQLADHRRHRHDVDVSLVGHRHLLVTGLDHVHEELVDQRRELTRALPPAEHVERALQPTVDALTELLAPKAQHWGVLFVATESDSPTPATLVLQHTGRSLPGTTEVQAFTLPHGVQPRSVLFTWGPVLLQAIQMNDARVLNQRAPFYLAPKALPSGQKIVFQIVVV